MATPTIKIDQATLGPGTAGVSRDDLIVGQLVTLTDPANGAGTYTWVLFEKPPGSTATLSGAATDTATFTPDIEGTYLVRLDFNGEQSGVDNAISEFVTTQGGMGVKFRQGTRALGAGETLQFDATDGWAIEKYNQDQALDGVRGILAGAHGAVGYVDANGDFVNLAPGTVGYVLRTGGPAANPSWVDPFTLAVDSLDSAYDFTGGGAGRKIVVDSGAVQMQTDAIGEATSVGLQLLNTTAAAAGTQQYSPRLRLQGEGWDGAATATVYFDIGVKSFAGSGGNEAHWLQMVPHHGEFEGIFVADHGGLAIIQARDFGGSSPTGINYALGLFPAQQTGLASEYSDFIFQPPASGHTYAGSPTLSLHRQFQFQGTWLECASPGGTLDEAVVLYIDEAIASQTGNLTIANRYALKAGGAIGVELVTPAGGPNVGIKETIVEGARLINRTASAAGFDQWSPALSFEGSGWKTAATAESQNVRFAMQLQTEQGSSAPTGSLHFLADVNDAGLASLVRMTTGGQLLVPAGGTASAPAYSFTGSGSDAGMFFNSPSTLDFVFGGSAGLQLGSSFVVANRPLLFDIGANAPSVRAGTVDPSAGAGVNAKEGSLFLRYQAAAGQLWLKTGTADAAWTELTAGGGGGTLDDAYDFGGAGAGADIVADSGAVTINNDAANNNNVLELGKAPAAAQGGAGASVTMGGNASSPGVLINHSGTAVGAFALDITMASGAGADAIIVRAHETGDGLFITSTGAFDNHLINLSKNPVSQAGNGINLDMGSGTTGIGVAVSMNASSTGAGLQVTAGGGLGLDINQTVQTSGSPTLVEVTGAAHTTLTASAEASDVIFDLARTVQFSTGAITDQRAIKIDPPTYAFVAASTVTRASVMEITGPPAEGTNATLDIAANLALRNTGAGAGFGTVGAFLYNDTTGDAISSAPGVLFEARSDVSTGQNVLGGFNVIGKNAIADSSTSAAYNRLSFWGVSNGTFAGLNELLFFDLDQTGILPGATGMTLGNSVIAWAGGYFESSLNNTDTILTVSKTPGASNAGHGISLTMGANATGHGIEITQSGSGSALRVNSGAIYARLNAIGASSADADVNILAINETAAAAGAQQFSPMVVLEGQGWETTGGSSDEIQYGLQVQPVQGTAAGGSLHFLSNVNDAGFTSRFQMTTGGQLLGPNGSNAAPTYSLASDPDTGWYGNGAGAVVIATAGVEAIRWNASQQTLVASSGSAPTLAAASDSDTGLGWPGGNILSFYQNGTERWRVNSTGALLTTLLGSAGTAAIARTTATNTGFFWISTTGVGVTAAGTEIARFDSSAFTVSSGVTAQFNGAIGHHQTSITSTSNSVATNASVGNSFIHTLTENTTLANPTNMITGSTYIWKIVQGAGPFTLAFGTAFKWPGGTTPTVSTGSGDIDLISAYYDGTNLLATYTNAHA